MQTRSLSGRLTATFNGTDAEYISVVRDETHHIRRAQEGDVEKLEWLAMHTHRARKRAADIFLPFHPGLHEDAMQEGWLGVLDALRKYNAARGVRFINFVANDIANRVKNYSQKMRDTVRKPSWVYRAKAKIDHMKAAGLGRAEIADRLGYSECQVETLSRAYQPSLSVNVRVNEDSDLEFEDTLVGSTGEEIHENVSPEGLCLSVCLGKLTDFDRELLTCMYGLDGKPCLSKNEICRLMGLSAGEFETRTISIHQQMRSLLSQEEEFGCSFVLPLCD